MLSTGLPTGIVTFFFSDIEGSTRLLGSLGDQAFAEILDSHHRLVREALAAHHGTEIATEGDSFFAVFIDAAHALAAAVSIQMALATGPWPNAPRISVRIGLHTGEARLGGDNYVGVDVHRAARIADAANGGQTLISGTTASLVSNSLPPGVTVDQLGRFVLADLPSAEPLFQVTAPGAPASFPPLRRARTLSRIPVPMTEFIGREEELRRGRELLETNRLVTLTGPGGTGKTRLSIELARQCEPSFTDGVFFVPLAQLRDADLIPATILDSLGLQSTGATPDVHLLDYLSDKTVLLVLDNFEQLQAGALFVAGLLTATPALNVLVTSRSPLRIAGEVEFPVMPLPVPDIGTTRPDQLIAVAGVRLFASRAGAVRPGFVVTEENAAAVTAIARRLDGLPLAIELAASRMRSLTPELILERLNNRLLSSNAPDLPGRQQTIIEAIGWSYDLLTEPRRLLFERCSAFGASFDLGAAERICAGDGDPQDVLEGLAELVENSLLVQPASGGTARFRMLTVIKEYGFAALVARGEDHAVLERLAIYYLEVAERANGGILTSNRGLCFEMLDAEHDNVRTAIDFAIQAGLPSVALRLAAAMWRYWQIRGHILEAEQRVVAALGLVGGSDGERAGALLALGGLLYWKGKWGDTMESYAEAAALLKGGGDTVEYADALYNLAFPTAFLGDLEEAARLHREALSLSERLGYRLGVGRAYWGLCDVAGFGARWEEALRYARRAASELSTIDAPFDLGWSHFMLAFSYEKLGHLDEARASALDALDLFADVTDLSAMTLILELLGVLAFRQSDRLKAARLGGVVRRLRRETGAAIGDVSMNQNPEFEQFLFSQQGAPGYEDGQAMSLDEALSLARHA